MTDGLSSSDPIVTGPMDTWVSQVGSGRFVNLTRGNETDGTRTKRRLDA